MHGTYYMHLCPSQLLYQLPSFHEMYVNIMLLDAITTSYLPD